jgi:sarcosine oxidase
LLHEVLNSAEITKRFPGYHLPGETMALWQGQGGFLVPERCIVAYVNAAIAHGAEIHGRERTLEYAPTATGGVRVRTDRGVYEADTLIVAAGAWNGNLLPFLKDVAVPERQVVAWLQPSAPQDFRPDRFPVFNLLVDEGRFYGFPQFEVPGFKFGKYHHLEEQGDAEQILTDRHWAEPNDQDEAVLRQFAERYFPNGAGPTMALATCMFTNAPDEHFIIDQHPDQPAVWFISACSGHGFKFASVMGEIMADLATQGTTRHDISLFRLARLHEGAAAPA